MAKALFAVVLLAAVAGGVTALSGASFAGTEVRGAWVTSWEDGFKTPAQVDATIAAVKEAGLNALFIEVRKFADAYYDSKLEPKGPEVPAGFDPLAYTIEKAHADGIQVHAWVVVYRAWSGAKTGPTDPNHIIKKHPDWVMIDTRGRNWAGEGMFLDPGIPEVRDYIVGVFEDIAKRYKIDGMQYDYVRYPGRTWGYSDLALKHYYADTGATERPRSNDPKWMQWRRDQVSLLVKQAHDRIKAVNPKCRISASTICYGDASSDWQKTSPYSSVLQDWYRWMREGWIEINIPMNYRQETNAAQAKQFRDWIACSEDWNGGRPVYQGIFADILSPDNVLKQIEATRKAGQEGFVLFAFNPGKHRDAMLDTLAKTLGPSPKLQVNEPVPMPVVEGAGPK